MQLPEHGRYVMIAYGKDGSRKAEAHGYGGTKCHQAMTPYNRRQGDTDTKPTDEAAQPSFTDIPVASPERSTA